MQEHLWAVSTSCSGLLASTSTCLGLASLVFESSEEDCWITVADLSKFSDGEFAIDCSCLRRWKVYWTQCHLWSRFFIKFSIFNSVSRPWWWPKWVDLCLSGWQQIEWKPSSFMFLLSKLQKYTARGKKTSIWINLFRMDSIQFGFCEWVLACGLEWFSCSS